MPGALQEERPGTVPEGPESHVTPPAGLDGRPAPPPHEGTPAFEAPGFDRNPPVKGEIPMGTIPHEGAGELPGAVDETVPAWLPEMMAGGLSSWFLRTYGRGIPDELMPGVAVHMRAAVANIIQAALLHDEARELLRVVQRRERWREVGAHPFDCSCWTCLLREPLVIGDMELRGLEDGE